MNISISNLASSVTAHDLRQLFTPYGAVGIDPHLDRPSYWPLPGLWLRGHD